MEKKGLAEALNEEAAKLGSLGNIGSTKMGSLKKVKVSSKPTVLPTLGK